MLLHQRRDRGLSALRVGRIVVYFFANWGNSFENDDSTNLQQMARRYEDATAWEHGNGRRSGASAREHGSAASYDAERRHKKRSPRTAWSSGNQPLGLSSPQALGLSACRRLPPVRRCSAASTCGRLFPSRPQSFGPRAFLPLSAAKVEACRRLSPIRRHSSSVRSGRPSLRPCPSALLWTKIAEGLYEQGQKSLKGCKCVSFFAEGLYSLQPFCDFRPPKVRERPVLLLPAPLSAIAHAAHAYHPRALIGNRGRCVVSTPARPFGCSRRRCAGPAQTARSVPLRPARPRKPRTRYRLDPAPAAARARHRIRKEWYARRR